MKTNPNKPFIHKNMFGLIDDYFNKEHRWNVYLIVFKDCKIYESLKNVLDDPNSVYSEAENLYNYAENKIKSLEVQNA